MAVFGRPHGTSTVDAALTRYADQVFHLYVAARLDQVTPEEFAARADQILTQGEFTADDGNPDCHARAVFLVFAEALAHGIMSSIDKEIDSYASAT